MSELDIIFDNQTQYNVLRYPDSVSSRDLPTRFFSLTRTAVETSVVCSTTDTPQTALYEHKSGPWALMYIRGPLSHDLTGILHKLSGPLERAKIPIFALSTYDTDYVLVPSDKKQNAISALQKDGWKVVQ